MDFELEIALRRRRRRETNPTARSVLSSMAGAMATERLGIKRIVVVSCGKAKDETGIMPASALYTGSLTSTAIKYAQAEGEQWRILSAKYGLIKPERAISSYKRTLYKMTASEKAGWRRHVRTQLRELLRYQRLQGHDQIQLELHAGKLYLEQLELAARDFDGLTLTMPVEGMIGMRLQWYRMRREMRRGD